MKVLIVEDDSLERKALGKLFSLCFDNLFEVFTASDGETALERLEHFPFDLVILDINLPGKSGLEVLHTITENYPSIKVIMATAYADYSYWRESLREKAFDYLVKPYSMETFKEAIGRFLDERTPEETELFGNKKTAQIIKQYLDEHYQENITLQQLADLTHHDKSYIGRLFRSEYGLSIFSCLSQIRMKLARQLLSQGMNVSETARAVGFEDPAYFGRCFKQIVGVSPQQFVRQ
jgi:two-component system response regulator YesN